MKTTVLSLGGSIVAPDNVDSAFLRAFREAIGEYLDKNEDARLILTVGGGAPAREYQKAAREIDAAMSSDELDWLGIRATHLNAMLLRAVFDGLCLDDIVTDPTAESVSFTGRILVAGGWKPGFSTDTDAVYLAKRFGGSTVINLSNIRKVYTDDPRKNPEAKPIDSISWKDFRKIVGDEWVPGKNTPFDPIASRLAEEAGIQVICAEGHSIENTIAILEGKPFEGTTIGA